MPLQHPSAARRYAAPWLWAALCSARYRPKQRRALAPTLPTTVPWPGPAPTSPTVTSSCPRRGRACAQPQCRPCYWRTQRDNGTAPSPVVAQGLLTVRVHKAPLCAQPPTVVRESGRPRACTRAGAVVALSSFHCRSASYEEDEDEWDQVSVRQRGGGALIDGLLLGHNWLVVGLA
jgi:hypothetical protein